jgi:hypothetical protein
MKAWLSWGILGSLAIAGGLGLGLGAPAAVAAERVCGTVWSSGAPVRGAHVVATERGLVAVTDSLGAFCFESVDPGTVSLLAAAIGFQPAERLVTVAPGMTPVHLELVPLRGASVGSAINGGAAAPAAPPGASGPASAPGTEAPAPAAPEPPALSGPEAALFVDLPVLVLPADSEWLATKHKGDNWAALLALHAALSRGAGLRGVLTPRAWRTAGDRAHDLYVDGCAGEGPHKHALDSDACAYVERAAALADARAVSLGGGRVSRNTKVLLQRLAGSRDGAISAWARALLERIAAASGTPAPASPGGPGEKR